MRTIAIVNEKGGTGKTTTSVNLAAALGELGHKVLLVDLDGQAASSRWLGIEEDTSFADALWRGKGLTPLPDVMPNVSLAPGSGKMDSVAHDLRPTQGGQLRKLLSEANGFKYILIDCPPSLGNRLIGNALLAASHAIVPVETSILAPDGLRILLTTLEDIREGFGHPIELAGVLACRFDSRTKLSRMVLAELKRALPGKVFTTVIRENVRMRECPASSKSILAYAPDSHAAEDYRALAVEVVALEPIWGAGGATSSVQFTAESLNGCKEMAASLCRDVERGRGAKAGESAASHELDIDESVGELPASQENVGAPTGDARAEALAALERLVAAKESLRAQEDQLEAQPQEQAQEADIDGIALDTVVDAEAYASGDATSDAVAHADSPVNVPGHQELHCESQAGDSNPTARTSIGGAEHVNNMSAGPEVGSIPDAGGNAIASTDGQADMGDAAGTDNNDHISFVGTGSNGDENIILEGDSGSLAAVAGDYVGDVAGAAAKTGVGDLPWLADLQGAGDPIGSAAVDASGQPTPVADVPAIEQVGRPAASFDMPAIELTALQASDAQVEDRRRGGDQQELWAQTFASAGAAINSEPQPTKPLDDREYPALRAMLQQMSGKGNATSEFESAHDDHKLPAWRRFIRAAVRK